MEPPWKPGVADETDFSHIEDAQDTRRYDTISDIHQALFAGF